MLIVLSPAPVHVVPSVAASRPMVNDRAEKRGLPKQHRAGLAVERLIDTPRCSTAGERPCLVEERAPLVPIAFGEGSPFAKGAAIGREREGGAGGDQLPDPF